MTMPQSELIWRKSSYSGAENDCVEVAQPTPGAMLVRDSKRVEGPVIGFAAAAWSVFATAVSRG
ncbi:DUF397 domain-containing protein [Streptomyces sp. BI20]|uniref:DUF397 domain-containing protein n=1 Tax=Streptomyces sp. BI20 TaxID=3403460 RepID=UPI003C720585